MQILIDIALSLLYFGAFLLLTAWTWRFWKMYVNQKFLNTLNDDFIMLEIKIPREIFKSPLAAEIAIGSMLQGGGVGNWYDKHIKGNLPIYSSLEIASIEGIIHFYVRTQKRFKSLVESNFYAQYPGIEIVEASDYTNVLRYEHRSADVSCWGATYYLDKKWSPTDEKTGMPTEDEKKKMNADFLPLKTYTDYGLEENPKEEFKIDPLAILMEFMGGIGKGEHLWYQIIFQDESVYNDKKFPKFFVNPLTHKHVSLSDMAKMRKDQIRTASVIKKGSTATDKYGRNELDKGKAKEGEEAPPIVYEKDVVTWTKDNELNVDTKFELEMINKKLSKPMSMATVRLMYVAKKENFNPPQNIQKILAYPKPYVGPNGFAFTVTDPYAYSWQKMGGKRPAWRAEEMFEAYVEREAFYPHIPERKELDKFEDRVFWHSSMGTRKMWRLLYEAIFHPFEHPHPEGVSALNMEEIATLWHLPGTVVTTPTLPRIDSAKAVAPVNLPQ